MREAFFISLANSCRPEPSEGRPLEPTELHLTLIETFESVKKIEISKSRETKYETKMR